MTEVFRQAGRLAVVTGATSGLGYETALALARAGADVVVAGRDEARGRELVTALRPLAPAALVRFERLDLASLHSVAEFAARMVGAARPVDLLVNNARAAVTGRRRVTADGFEMQLGLNYLGHFALTAGLLPLLRRSRQPRVVHLSSASHGQGAIHFDDLQLEHTYRPRRAERQSALAALLFAIELQRRSDAHGWGVLSVAARPGAVRSQAGNDDEVDARPWRQAPGVVSWRSAKAGAMPILFAATARHVKGGGYYGPTGALGLIGPPGAVAAASRAQDAGTAQMLWATAERLTGASWGAGA